MKFLNTLINNQIMVRLWFLSLIFLLSNCAHFSNTQAITNHKDGYSITRNIVYTPSDWPEKIQGDLYRPKSFLSAPAVLLIHGGGWTGRDGRWQMNPIAKKLAKKGYVVLNVTYRLAPSWIFPAPVEDLQEAVKWMRLHAEEYGIDPQRIATFGYSAGGYLATMTGLIDGPKNSNIRAIVAGGAPSDFTFYPGGDLVPQFLGGTQREEASSVNYLKPDSPPMFIYHATGDQLVRMEHPEAMVVALRKNRLSYETYWIKDRGHIAAFLLPSGSIDAAIQFLDRRMFK